MLKGKGFRSVGRVEVKAETTLPGDSTRRRRALPKLDFTVFENGALIKGPQYDCRYALRRDGKANEAAAFTLNDSRATTLAIKCKKGKFYCGASLERFSGHTGICRVLGNRRLACIPYSLKLGDLVRIGSVGLVVCELNRSDREESLTEDELSALKQHYLSVPLNGDSKTAPLGEYDHGSEYDAQQGSSGADDTSDDEETSGAEDGDAGDLLVSQLCYICYDGETDEAENPLVAPCKCKGDTKFVHLNCLQRWNNNEHLSGANAKVVSVTNIDGLDVCSICKTTYQTSVRLDRGRVVSLLAKKLPAPYLTFAVVTQHETRSRATALTNTRFQMSFATPAARNGALTIGRSTSNHMVLRYRTVSQSHAKVKFQGNEFLIMDTASSNGTMLFLSKPLELQWGKVVHVKIGRTIMAMKAKRRWKWGTTSSSDDKNSTSGETEEQHDSEGESNKDSGEQQHQEVTAEVNEE